jgi:hypothetical protein
VAAVASCRGGTEHPSAVGATAPGDKGGTRHSTAEVGATAPGDDGAAQPCGTAAATWTETEESRKHSRIGSEAAPRWEAGKTVASTTRDRGERGEAGLSVASPRPSASCNSPAPSRPSPSKFLGDNCRLDAGSGPLYSDGPTGSGPLQPAGSRDFAKVKLATGSAIDICPAGRAGTSEQQLRSSKPLAAALSSYPTTGSIKAGGFITQAERSRLFVTPMARVA